MRLSDRHVLRLTGADSVAFLDSLVTNRVTGDAPCYAALLTPQGRVVAEMFVVPQPADESLLLDVPACQSASLCAALSRYKLRRTVTVDFSPGVHVTVSATPLPDGYPDPRLEALGWRGFVPAAADGEAGGEDVSAYRARCHALGVPPFVPADALPLEYNLDFLNGVSFTKGCYVGQEVTARMHHRNLVKKRLFAHDGTPGPDAFSLAALGARDPQDPPIRRPDWMKL